VPIDEKGGPFPSGGVRGDDNELVRQHDAMWEVMWGGPGRPTGLVGSIDKLAESVKRNSRILYGNGSSGLRQQVGEHEKFVAGFRDNWKWLLRIVATQLLIILLAGGAVIYRAAISGG